MRPHNTMARFAAAFSIVVLAGALAAGCATTLSGPVTDRDGMTLYTFDKDNRGSGESNCYGDCAATWPPVPADAAGGEHFGSITRLDGTQQLTYEGRPVYYYAGDNKPGDMKGEGFAGVWHAVRNEPKTSGGGVDSGY